jgi:hypothetical protein
MAAKNLDRCCKARAKSGKPCRAAATAGGLCFFHANPNNASELGRIGGRSKRHPAAEIADPLPVLNSAIAVRDTLARLIADVYAGSRVRDQKSYLLGIKAAEQGRFPQLLIGSQKDTSLWGVFAPTQGRC